MKNDNSNFLMNNCSVCFEKLEDEKVKRGEEMNLTKCSKCKLAVHLGCVGDKRTDFICGRCKCKEKGSSKASCDICHRNIGIMLQYKPKKFAHIFCALFTDLFKIIDISTMKFEYDKNIDNILKENAKKNNECNICKKKQGIMMKCDGCNTNVHLYCVMMQKVDEDANDQDKWKIKFELRNTSNDIHKRGGKITLLCPQHKGIETYCICKTSDGESPMLCCDNCDSWYHCKCLKINPNSLNRISESVWLCEICKAFFERKKKYSTESVESLSKEAVGNKWSNQIINNLLNFKVSDFIYLGEVLLNRIKCLNDHKCTFSIIEETLQDLMHFPFLFDETVYGAIYQKKQTFLDMTKDNGSTLRDSIEKKLSSTAPINEELFNEIKDLYNKMQEREKYEKKLMENNNLVVSTKFLRIGIILDAVIENIKIILKKDVKKKLSEIKENIKAVNSFFFENQGYLLLNVISKGLTKCINEYNEFLSELRNMIENYKTKKLSQDKIDKEFLSKINKEKNESARMKLKKEQILSCLQSKVQQEAYQSLVTKSEGLVIDATAELTKFNRDFYTKTNEIVTRINSGNFTIKAAKEILKQIPLIIITSDIIKDFVTHFYSCMNLIQTTKEILAAKDYKSLESQLKAYNEIKYINDEILNSQKAELQKISNEIASIKSSTQTLIGTEVQIKDIQNQIEKLKEYNIKDEVLQKKLTRKLYFISNFEVLLSLKKCSTDELESMKNELNELQIPQREKLIEEINRRIEIIKKIDEEINSKIIIGPEEVPEEFIEKTLRIIRENYIAPANEKILNDYNMLCEKIKKFASENLEKIEKEEREISVTKNCMLYHDLSSSSPMRIKIEQVYSMIKTTNIKLLKKDSKISIESISIFFNDDLENLPQLQASESENNNINQKEILISKIIKAKTFNALYTSLKTEVYDKEAQNLEKCKNDYTEIQNILPEIKKYLDVKKEEDDLAKINNLINLDEKILNFISENKNKDTKQSFLYLKSSLNEFLDQSEKKDLFAIKELKNEVEKIEKFKQFYEDYRLKKKKKLYDQINLDHVKEAITVGPTLMSSVSTECDYLRLDLESTLSFNSLKSQFMTGDPFSLTIVKKASQTNLVKVMYEFNKDHVLVNDKATVETFKAIEFCIKVLKKFVEVNKVEYNEIIKILNEGTNLKRYNEVKKEGYMQTLLNQLSIAKNFKDVADSLIRGKGKQIPQEEFEKIVKSFNSLEGNKIILTTEKEFMESLIKTKNDFFSNLEKYSKNQAQLSDFEKLSVEIEKFPIKLSELRERVNRTINVTKILQKEIRRMYEIVKKSSIKTLITIDKVTSLVGKVKNNDAIFQEGEELIKNYDDSLERISKLQKMVKDKDTDLFDMLALRDGITIHDLSKEKEINKVIWLKKYQEFIVKAKPTFLIVEHLLNETKEIPIEDEAKLNKLKTLYANGMKFISMIQNCTSNADLEEVSKKLSDCEVDLNEYIIEASIRIHMKIPSKKPPPTINTFIGNKRKKSEDKEEKREKKERKEKKEKEEPANATGSGNNLGTRKELKKISNELNEEISGFAANRSKRKIKRKVDADYYYGKEFVDEFDNKIGRRDETKEEESMKEDSKRIIQDEDEDASIESEAERESMSSSEEKERRKEPKDQTPLSKNYPTKKQKPLSSFRKEEEPLRTTIKQSIINQLENIIKQNPFLSKEGPEFIEKMSVGLEADLAKAYPKRDAEYQKTFQNITKTLKELEKYERVCSLIKKGKVTLFKMVRFPYGKSYISKLEGIEKGANRKPKPEPPKDNFNLISSAKELYASLGSDKNEKRDEDKGIAKLYSVPNTSSNLNMENSNQDDEGSLMSIDEQDNIKFSPTTKDTQKNASSLMQLVGESSGMPVDKTEKLYDPFAGDDNRVDPSPFSERKKRVFAVFYNPLNKKKKERVPQRQPIIDPPPPHSLLQLFRGRLTLNKVQMDNISLLSTQSYELSTMLPGFSGEILITSRSKTNEVVPYCEKQLNNKSKIELFGWIEVDNDNIEKYVSICEEYDKHDKCGCLIIHNIKFYVFVLSPKYPKFNKIVRQETKFYNKSFEGLDKILVFVYVANKADVDCFPGKKLTPIVLRKNEITSDKQSYNTGFDTIEEQKDEDDMEVEEEPDDEEEKNDEKLEELLKTNDMKLLEEYVNNNFSGCTNEEIIKKLEKFNIERRMKLLDLITQYKISTGEMNQQNEEGQEEVSQQRIEEVINEEQMKRMNQINNQQMPMANMPQMQQQMFYPMNMPNMPNPQNMPGIPGMGTLPNMPNMQNMPNMPNIPSMFNPMNYNPTVLAEYNKQMLNKYMYPSMTTMPKQDK